MAELHAHATGLDAADLRQPWNVVVQQDCEWELPGPRKQQVVPGPPGACAAHAATSPSASGASPPSAMRQASAEHWRGKHAGKQHGRSIGGRVLRSVPGATVV